MYRGFKKKIILLLLIYYYCYLFGITGRLQVELAKSASRPSQDVSSTSDATAEPPSKKRRTALFGHYRTATASQSPSATSFTTASQQLHRYLTLINTETFDPTAASSHLDQLVLDFPLLQPLFSRVFCVPASSAPVERIFSHSGIIMSARRARMSNAVLETLVFLKCNSHL